MSDNTNLPQGGNPNGEPGSPPTTPPPAPPSETDSAEDKRLARENAKWRNEVRTLEKQQQEQSALLAEIKALLETERKARADAEDAVRKAQAEAQRTAMLAQVAAKYNLPPALAQRLKGDTPEALEADAQELAQLVKPQGTQRATSVGLVGDAQGASRAAQLTNKVLGKGQGVRFTAPYEQDTEG